MRWLLGKLVFGDWRRGRRLGGERRNCELSDVWGVSTPRHLCLLLDLLCSNHVPSGLPQRGGTIEHCQVEKVRLHFPLGDIYVKEYSLIGEGQLREPQAIRELSFKQGRLPEILQITHILGTGKLTSQGSLPAFEPEALIIGSREDTGIMWDGDAVLRLWNPLPGGEQGMC